MERQASVRACTRRPGDPLRRPLKIRYAIVKRTLSQRRLERQLQFQKGSPLWERAEGRFRMRGYAHRLAHGLGRVT